MAEFKCESCGGDSCVSRHGLSVCDTCLWARNEVRLMIRRSTIPEEVVAPIRNGLRHIVDLWKSQEAKEARRLAAEQQSYDDLVASGGIVDAP